MGVCCIECIRSAWREDQASFASEMLSVTLVWEFLGRIQDVSSQGLDLDFEGDGEDSRGWQLLEGDVFQSDGISLDFRISVWLMCPSQRLKCWR